MSRYEEIAARAEQTSQYRESSHTAPWEVELDRLFLLARVRELEAALAEVVTTPSWEPYLVQEAFNQARRVLETPEDTP